MSATDELRRLLDGRGVDYEDHGYTDWTAANGHRAGAAELMGELYFTAILTPEQAVEATLGSDLKAENDKLREERDMYRDLVGMMDHPDLNVQLQAENAKLRELVRDAIPYVDCHLGSDECVHMRECHGGNGCVFERLAHELGVDA